LFLVKASLANGAILRKYLSDGNLAQALKAIDITPAVRPNLPRLNIYRAQVLMFLDRVDEARTLYQRYADEKVDPDRIGKQLILQDFGAMRGVGLAHPLQDEIETCLQPTQAVKTS
jgi:hypothetical protein